MTRDAKSLLRASTQNFICSHTWAPAEGGQRRLKPHEESLELVALERDLEGHHQDPCAESFSHTGEAICPKESILLDAGSAWGKGIASPTRILLIPPFAA